MAPGRRYVLDDDRIVVEGEVGAGGASADGSATGERSRAEIRFTRRARGVPGCAHGGAVGAAYLVVPWRRHGDVLIRSIDIAFLAKTRVGVPALMSAALDGISHAEAGTAAASPGHPSVHSFELKDSEGVLLSKATLRADPATNTSESALVRSSAAAAREMEARLRRDPGLEAVSMPDFAVARHVSRAHAAEGWSHFEFHFQPRVLCQAFRPRLGPGGTRDTRIVGLLHVSRSALSDTSGRASVSEAALFAAIDEVMGSCVNYSISSPIVTAQLRVDFMHAVCFPDDEDEVVLLVECRHEQRKAESRKVPVHCEVHALLDPADGCGYEHRHGEPRRVTVATGTSVFVVLPGRL